MAGYIGVSARKGLSLSGTAFLYYAEKIREKVLQVGAHEYVQGIFFGHDESASDFITAEDLDEEAFDLFVKAMMLARNEEDPSDPPSQAIWDQLMGLIWADPRCRSFPTKRA